jgi:Cu/Ag efflux pump CusA
VRRVRSSSTNGFSVVWVEFDWGTDIYLARQIVSEKLAVVSESLPVNVGKPTLGPQSSILGEMLIVGHISVNAPIDSDLSYAWTLPEGVSVVEGVVSDQLANVGPGQTVELKITVIGFSKEHQSQVSLKASVQKGRMEMGDSALISSRPEDNWEAVAPEMQKAAEKELGTEKFRKTR